MQTTRFPSVRYGFLILSACVFLAVPATVATAATTIVAVDTAVGTFHMQMHVNEAPQTCAQILDYVEKGYYDNSFFHRFVPGFVLQGGGFTVDPDTKIIDKVLWETDPDYATLPLEYGTPNYRGTVAMARGSALDSASTQWFVNIEDNSETLSQANNGGYAVFAHVINGGMDVVDAMSTDPNLVYIDDLSEEFQDSAFNEVPIFYNDPNDPSDDDLQIIYDMRIVDPGQGDVNLDGVTDLDDLVSLNENYGSESADWSMGDLNGDWKINLTDLTIYGANMTPSPQAPAGDEVQALPEPATMGLLAAGSLALLRRRRRQ